MGTGVRYADRAVQCLLHTSGCILFWWRKLEWDGTVREATAYSYGKSEARSFSQFDSSLHLRRHRALASPEIRTRIRATC
jgi:hypothetical protein